MEAKEALALILECIDLPKFKKVVVIKIVIPFLEKFVKDTSNPYDDKLVEFVKTYAEKQFA